MTLLLLLINAKGQVVSRQQIRDAIWPKVIVGDEVITRLVFQLRNILGDDAKNPKYIETIPKKGYLFIADVDIKQPNQEDARTAGKDTANLIDTQNKQSAMPRANAKFSTKNWRLLFAIAFIAVVLLVINHQKDEPSNSRLNFSSPHVKGVKPITKLIGSEKDFAVSPDGQEMVFVHESSNATDLFLKNIQEMDIAKAITSDQWLPLSPIWIDDQTIAYIRHKNTQYQIVKHTINSVDSARDTILYESSQRIYTITYTGSKRHQIIFNQKRDNTVTELKSLDLNRLKVSLLKNTFVSLPEQIYSPKFSTKSNQLYFVASTQGNDSLMVLDYSNKQMSLISEAFERVNSYTFIEESSQIIIAGSHNGAIGIWHFNVNQNKITTVLLATSGEWITTVYWHSDQESIYYDTFFRHSDILKVSKSSPQVDQLVHLNSRGNEYSARYSELHHAIFYVSDRSGDAELWRYDLDTKVTRQVTQINAKWILKPTISNDGEQVAFSYKNDSFVLGVFDLETGDKMASTILPYQKYPLAWSADDQFIYVSEHRININLFRYRASDLSVELEQKYGGLLARENESNQIVFVDYSTNKLVRKNRTDRSQEILIDQIPQLSKLTPLQVQFDGSGLYAEQIHDNKHRLYYYPNASATEPSPKQSLVMELPDSVTISDINHNASSILVIRRNHADGDVMKVEFANDNHRL